MLPFKKEKHCFENDNETDDHYLTHPGMCSSMHDGEKWTHGPAALDSDAQPFADTDSICTPHQSKKTAHSVKQGVFEDTMDMQIFLNGTYSVP